MSSGAVGGALHEASSANKVTLAVAALPPLIIEGHHKRSLYSQYLQFVPGRIVCCRPVHPEQPLLPIACLQYKLRLDSPRSLCQIGSELDNALTKYVAPSHRPCSAGKCTGHVTFTSKVKHWPGEQDKDCRQWKS